MPEIPTPKSAAEDLTKLAKDTVYVSVGLAVIAGGGGDGPGLPGHRHGGQLGRGAAQLERASALQ